MPAQTGQRRRLAHRAVVHGEGGLVPGADQQPTTDRALFQWRALMRAVGLVGTHPLALAYQDDFFGTNLNAQGTELFKLVEASHGMEGHGDLLTGCVHLTPALGAGCAQPTIGGNHNISQKLQMRLN